MKGVVAFEIPSVKKLVEIFPTCCEEGLTLKDESSEESVGFTEAAVFSSVLELKLCELLLVESAEVTIGDAEIVVLVDVVVEDVSPTELENGIVAVTGVVERLGDVSETTVVVVVVVVMVVVDVAEDVSITAVAVVVEVMEVVDRVEDEVDATAEAVVDSVKDVLDEIVVKVVDSVKDAVDEIVVEVEVMIVVGRVDDVVDAVVEVVVVVGATENIVDATIVVDT